MTLFLFLVFAQSQETQKQEHSGHVDVPNKRNNQKEYNNMVAMTSGENQQYPFETVTGIYLQKKGSKLMEHGIANIRFCAITHSQFSCFKFFLSKTVEGGAPPPLALYS